MLAEATMIVYISTAAGYEQAKTGTEVNNRHYLFRWTIRGQLVQRLLGKEKLILSVLGGTE